MSPRRNASLILRIHRIVIIIWIHFLPAYFQKLKKLVQPGNVLGNKRRVVKYVEQNCDSEQGQESTPIKASIQATPPIDENAIDQCANGNDAQTLANNDSTTEQLVSTTRIRETTESFTAQFGQDTTPDPEVQVLSPSQF